MADNFLEYSRQEYEKRKEEWLAKKRHMSKTKRQIMPPEDEAL
ncbi:dehydrogenase [Prevotella sp. OH937_COT-195]|nr:dehydrogenase [Prevotella sp. OH937_COT-195]RRD00877.1 dehydrogenase [Prevotella sp. OH937_COT-195]